MKRILFRTLLGGHGNFSFSLNCITSFIKYCKNDFTIEIFEDGSLSTLQIEQLEKLSHLTIVFKTLRDKILNHKLNNLPHCKNFRKNHVFAYKILDTMIYDEQNFYYLDSDVIFLRDFTFEDNYPKNPTFMKDIESSYSFSPYRYLINSWRVYPKLNAGFMFFPKKLFDLEKLEVIIMKNFSSQELKNCWAEQTMWAFLASSYTTFLFNSSQIVMANAFTKRERKTIAIHLTTPYRYKIDTLSNSSHKEILTDLKKEIINTKMIKSYLSTYSYFSWMVYNKLQRKIMKLLSKMPNKF